MIDSRTERNQKIYELRVVTKIPVKEVAEMYHIGKGRVSQIVKKEALKHRNPKDIPLMDRIINEFCYLDEEQLDTLGRKPCSSVSATINTVFRYLRRTNVGLSVKDIYQLFLNMKYDELIHLRNMGKNKVSLVIRIQDIIERNKNYYRFKFLNDCIKISNKDYALF